MVFDCIFKVQTLSVHDHVAVELLFHLEFVFACVTRFRYKIDRYTLLFPQGKFIIIIFKNLNNIKRFHKHTGVRGVCVSSPAAH